MPTPGPGWTFLTNYARVLVQIARDPGARTRDIAVRCRLTERAVQRIIAELEVAGCLTPRRQGRGNLYHVVEGTVLRHPAAAGASVADLPALLHIAGQPRWERWSGHLPEA